MSSEIFIQVADRAVGPLTLDAMREKVASGAVTPATPVRIGTDGQWMPASRIKRLFSEGQPVAVAANPAPAATPAPLPPRRPEPTAEPQFTPPAFPLAAAPSRAKADYNPNLQPCLDCGQMLSKKAATCPHCGAKESRSILPGVVGQVLSTIGLAIAFLGMLAFSCAYPTTLDGTHNIGLIADRICGTMFFGVLFLVFAISRAAFSR